MRSFEELRAEAQRLMDLRKERDLTFQESLAFSALTGEMIEWVKKWEQPTAYDRILDDDAP